MMSKPERFTNATGAPVTDNTNISTAGRRGPALVDPAYGDGVARALKLNVAKAA
jgi:hypothetical protein